MPLSSNHARTVEPIIMPIVPCESPCHELCYWAGFMTKDAQVTSVFQMVLLGYQSPDVMVYCYLTEYFGKLKNAFLVFFFLAGWVATQSPTWGLWSGRVCKRVRVPWPGVVSLLLYQRVEAKDWLAGGHWVVITRHMSIVKQSTDRAIRWDEKKEGVFCRSMYKLVWIKTIWMSFHDRAIWRLINSRSLCFIFFYLAKTCPALKFYSWALQPCLVMMLWHCSPQRLQGLKIAIEAFCNKLLPFAQFTTHTKIK